MSATQIFLPEVSIRQIKLCFYCYEVGFLLVTLSDLKDKNTIAVGNILPVPLSDIVGPYPKRYANAKLIRQVR